MEKNRTIVVLLGILVVIATGVILRMAQPIILPLVIAWLLSYVLGPIVDSLKRLKIPSPVAIGIVLLMLLVTGLLAGVFLNARISAFTAAFPRYQERLIVLLKSISESTGVSSDVLSKIDWEWSDRIARFVMSASGSLARFAAKLFLVIIFLIFLLLGRPHFKRKVETAFSSPHAARILKVTHSISAQIGKYLAIQFFISLATGFCVWAGLKIIGVDFPVTWGVLAFFLNFIPTVGSIVASIPPVLVAIVQFASIWHAVLTLFILLAIQVTIGNIISPKVLGDRLSLSPLVVLVSLVFWGWLWGFMGALLSVPIASAIKIICENIESLRPVGVMMGSGKNEENIPATS